MISPENPPVPACEPGPAPIRTEFGCVPVTGPYSPFMEPGAPASPVIGARRRRMALALMAGIALSLRAWAHPDDPGSPPPELPPVDCPADLNGDGFVSGYDLGYLLSEWGDPAPALGGDINRDGVINGIDIGILLGAWGDCPGD